VLVLHGLVELDTAEGKSCVYQAHGTVRNPLAVRECRHWEAQELTLVEPVPQDVKSPPQPVLQYSRIPNHKQALNVLVRRWVGRA
jgi:hypothetical protein